MAGSVLVIPAQYLWLSGLIFLKNPGRKSSLDCSSSGVSKAINTTAEYRAQIHQTGRSERCCRYQSRNSPAASGEETTLEQVHPEVLQPMEGPTLDRGKGVRRKEQQNGAVTD